MQTIVVDEYTPSRRPVQKTLALSTTPADIGATITDQSDTDWELTCSAAWAIGDSNGQLRTVAANEPFNVPSSSLSGWWVKAGSGTPTLVLMGAKKVSP